MPRVKLDYVVSFSSEDPENPANNLLAYEVSKKKWLCNAGEPSCSVVLQLKSAVQISTVHIGAYHAALVEVLVGRSETPNDQFEVLVPSSVFLSPMDSRRGTGVERVRSFSADQLAPARLQKWDRVRIVCSQPYNKHCKYGLSFVHIFETEDKAKQPVSQPVAPAIATRITAVNNYSSDEDDFRPGELFAKHRQSSDGNKNTGAQIRQASSQALRNINDSATKLVKTPIAKTNSSRNSQVNDFNTSRQKDNLMYTDDDEKPHAKIDSIVQRHKDEKEQETIKKEAVQNLFKKNTERANRLEQASKSFKEFLDDKNDNSRSNDNSRENDRRNKDLNNSSSKDSFRDVARNNKDSLNNSRSQDSSKDNNKRNADNLNNSRNKDSSRDDRRNTDDGNSSQSRTKVDKGGNGDRENRKRQHSDERQKGKDAEALRPGPVSASPHTLMSGVVFALSGYENPRRGRLRDAAIAMGARFERDWNPTCTHLICAFPNTPKLRTVRSSTSGANCIAVLGEWIEQCCEKRRLLPWQWFATEPKKKVQPPAGWDDNDDKTASECDTDDEIEKVLRKQKKQRTDKSPSPQPGTSRDLSPKQNSSEKLPDPYSSKEKSPKPPVNKEKSPKASSSKEKQRKQSRDRSQSKESSKRNLNYSNMSSDSDVAFVKDERIQANITIDSGDSTDEEKPVVKEKIDKKCVLPDFFDGYTFVIDDCVEDAGFDKELLSRYVKAYGGVVMDGSQLDSDSDVSFVLSATRGARARGGGGAGGGGGGGARARESGVRVRADWLWRCHEEKQLADLADYML